MSSDIYRVDLYFDPKTIYVRARNKAEARRKARARIKRSGPKISKQSTIEGSMDGNEAAFVR